MEIDIQRETSGRLRAVSLYPAFGRVGKLTVRMADAKKIAFEESLEWSIDPAEVQQVRSQQRFQR